MSAQTTSLVDRQRKIVALLQEKYLEDRMTADQTNELSHRLSVAISDLASLLLNGE